MTNFYSFCRQTFDLSATCMLVPAAENNETPSEAKLSEQTYSYQDLHTESGRIANYLRGIGLKKGQRVAVQVEKSPQNLFWYFACMRAGLIYLPLNTGYQTSELGYFVDNAGPSLILCDPAKKSIFTSLTKCPIETLDESGQCSAILPTEVLFEDEVCQPDDIAVILYTSGTTGKPKGAMISHGNLISNGQALSQAWQWQQSDVLLHALPIFHIHGLFVATHLSIMNGSKMIFLDKFTPQRIARHLPESTVYMGVPTNYVRLLDSGLLNPDVCENMRLFTSGSAPLLSLTFEAFQAATGHTIVERYGMTETGMNTSNPLEGKRKPGTVGPALPGTELRLVDKAGNDVEIGSPGDLLVKGDNVFQGYWQLPEKTAEEFTADGFFKTGDIASIDAEGYISIIGRDKDMIITGGLNVYPKELESFLDDLECIEESAVIGLAHADFGEAVTAIIVKQTNANINEDDIIKTMKMQLAAFKVAKQVHFVEALPRNTMGKVQKNLLRDKYSN